MTTEEYARQYMPGEIERQTDGARFDKLVSFIERGVPLPDEFESTVELATASYVKARYAERQAGYLPEEGFKKCIEKMRKRFITEYRAVVIQMTRYKEILRNGLLFSQKCAHLLKNIGSMSDEEIIDELLTLFGLVFNEVEEGLLRKAWNEGKKKRKKGKQSSEKVLKKKSTVTEQLPEELREAWNGFAQMRKAKRKPMTARAEEMMFKKLMTLAGGDVAAAGKILDESTRNGWTDVYALKSAEGRKQEVFTSDASYDIKAYEDELVALKFLEKDEY